MPKVTLNILHGGERYRFIDRFGYVIDAIGRMRPIATKEAFRAASVFVPRLRERLLHYSPREEPRVTAHYATDPYRSSGRSSMRLGSVPIRPNWQVEIGKFTGRGTRQTAGGSSISISNPAQHLNWLRFGVRPHTIRARSKFLKFWVGAPLRWEVRAMTQPYRRMSEIYLDEVEKAEGLKIGSISFKDIADRLKVKKRDFMRIFEEGWVYARRVDHPGILEYSVGGKTKPERAARGGVSAGHERDFVRKALLDAVKDLDVATRGALPRIFLPLREVFERKGFEDYRWQYPDIRPDQTIIGILQRMAR